MLIIGHRGAIEQDPENSFAAFDRAVQLRVARIEFDVHLAADGALCIMHDDDLARMTGRAGAIHALDRGQIEAYRLPNGEKIPFLDEVLTRYLPLMELNIEIKTPGAPVVDNILRLVEQHQMAERQIIFSSFECATIQYLASRYPNYRRALLWEREIYTQKGETGDPVALMLQCQSSIFHPDALQLDDALMQEARARHWLVYPYVSLRHEERLMDQLWGRLDALGVDGLCTNFPTKMGAWLKTR